MSPPQVKCAVSTTTNLYVSLNFFLDLSIVSSSVALPTRLVYVFDALYFIIQFHHMRVVSQDQSAEFRRRRYSKTSVRGEIRPKIGNFRYSSDICVVLPDLRNIRQIFVVCLTSRNIRQIFDSSSTTNEREACPQS